MNYLSINRRRPALGKLVTGYFFLHALATPLTSLAVYLELSLSLNPSPALKKYLEKALVCAKRLQQLWQLAEQPTLVEKTEARFYLKPAIQEVLDLLSGQYDQKLWLTTQLDCQQTTSLAGNRFFFQEALLCALKNAVESYAEDKNKVVRLAVSLDQRQQQLKLTIIDHGQGMGWWQKQLVFSDGYSSKNSHTGVGLSWVKTVVEDYFQGQVSLRSRKNQGTIMEWLMPLANDSQNRE